MPNSNGKLTAPLGIASLAQCTGNPMLDLGFQCMDSKPYFKYVNGSNIVYTTVYPTRNTAAITAGVLFVYSIKDKVCGLTNDNTQPTVTYKVQDALLGTASAATNSTITFNSIVYTWDNQNPFEIVRLFLVNMWSKFKPLNGFTMVDLTDTNRLNAGYGITANQISIDETDNDKLSALYTSLLNGNNGWFYESPTLDSYKRLTDFLSSDGNSGYDKGCENPFTLFAVNANGMDGEYHKIYISRDSSGTGLTANIKVGVKSDFPPTDHPTNLTFADLSGALGDIQNSGGYGFLVNGGSLSYKTPFDTDGKTLLYPMYLSSRDTPWIATCELTNLVVAQGYTVIPVIVSNRGSYALPLDPLKFKFVYIPKIYNLSTIKQFVSDSITVGGHTFTFLNRGGLLLTLDVKLSSDDFWIGNAITTVRIVEHYTKLKTKKTDTSTPDVTTYDYLSHDAHSVDYSSWDGVNSVNTNIQSTTASSMFYIALTDLEETLKNKAPFVSAVLNFRIAFNADGSQYEDISLDQNDLAALGFTWEVNK